MRILHVTHAFPRDDRDIAGAFIARLCAAQLERGHDVQVLAPADRGRAGKDRAGGVPVNRIRYAPSSWETLAYTGTMVEASQSVRGGVAAAGMVLSLAESIRASSADLVHAHWWVPGGLAARLARLLGGDPYVVTLHGTDVALMERLAAASIAARWVLRGARGVSAVSRFLARRAAHHVGMDPDDIMVQPMPLETDRFTCASAGGGGVVTVGRLTPQKRIDVVVDAVAAARAKGIVLRLTIVGDGPERRALERRAAAAGIGDITRFLGTVAPEAIPTTIGDADVFAFAAEGEGLGLAIAEALLLGVPVVAARSGGVPDLLGERDAPGMRLVPVGDADAFKGAIVEIVSGGADHRAAAAKAGTRLRRRLSPEAAAMAFETFYERALAGDRDA